jgi:putative toxin-antitoxin system antitoxin component (TIGR02293 family)
MLSIGNKKLDLFLKRYEGNLKDRLSLISNAKEGINSKYILQILKYFRFKKDFIAEMLNLSTKTLDRYTSQNRRLNPNDSELIIKLIILYNKGLEVFGDQESFVSWLNKSAFGLGNMKPVELINTSEGIDLIFEELLRIEFGDLS